ncbi:MAG: four helix bundle protein [Algoriphagus sp.]|uniref:four helix bundle protein n=1 Tax=Algoriphagus sp. TaxID=1872435 RepID=UPI0026282E67|nr:four helix bundle protein [Algoriphagus sp.]MDG1279060.1 four helix bundle protein [Algoriphagus sp.]
MENPIQNRTYQFAEKIISAYLILREKGHLRLADQLVGAGTSIGANVAEAQAAHSKLDFISKLTIANKEAREAQYWLNLMDRKELLADFEGLEFLKKEIGEIVLILNSIIKKSRENLKNTK